MRGPHCFIILVYTFYESTKSNWYSGTKFVSPCTSYQLPSVSSLQRTCYKWKHSEFSRGIISVARIKISSYYEKLHFDCTVIRWIDLLTPSLLYWTFVTSKLTIHSLTKDCRPCTSQVESDVYLCPVFRTSPSCILVPDVCELVATMVESPWAAARSSLVHGILYFKIQSTIRCSLHYLYSILNRSVL